MKISGRVVSRKAISLSRASKLISRFAAVENGSSPAVSIYLHRTSDAFNHLVQFHSKTKNFLSRLPSARRVRHRLLPSAAPPTRVACATACCHLLRAAADKDKGTKFTAEDIMQTTD